MLAVEEVEKRFGAVTALDRVSFSVGKGEVVGFLGPNGAGKTTTLRIATGFLPCDGGRVRVDGIDVAEDPLAAQRRIGYLPEGAPLPGEMRVGEYLAFRARLKGVRGVAAEVDDVLRRARVADVRGRPIGQLSKGYRQRVGLADALLGAPPILILDEPTAGLDPVQIREVRDLVRELAAERTVLLSSHILPEVEAVAGRVIILVGGRVVAEDTPQALRARLGGQGTRVRVAPDDAPRAEAALGEGAEITDAAQGRLRTPLHADEAARRLVTAGLALVEIAPEERTLEDVFVELTQGARAPGGAG